MSDHCVVGIITETNEAGVEADTDGDEARRRWGISGRDVDPVAIGDEGDELSSCGKSSGEGDVVGCGAVDGGADGTRSRTAIGSGFHCLEGGEKLGAVTSERWAEGSVNRRTAEGEDGETNTRLLVHGSIVEIVGSSERNLVNPRTEQAPDSDVTIGEAINAGAHVDGGIDEDVEIGGRDVVVRVGATLTVIPHTFLVTHARALSNLGPAGAIDTNTHVAGVILSLFVRVDLSCIPVAGAIDGATSCFVDVLGAESRAASGGRFFGLPAALRVGDALAFVGISTAPVLSADEVVSVGFVGDDGAHWVAEADGFKIGRFVTLVVEVASILNALGRTEAGFPQACRGASLAGGLELEVAEGLATSTAPVGDGVPDAVVFVVDAAGVTHAGDAPGVAAVPLRGIGGGHVVRAPSRGELHAGSVVVGRRADEALAELVVGVPQASWVSSTGTFRTVRTEATSGPAARRVVSLAVAVPVAHAVVVTGDFGLPIVAGAITSVVVVQDRGPATPARIAHFAEGLAGFTSGVVVEVRVAPASVGENPGDRIRAGTGAELQDDHANSELAHGGFQAGSEDVGG